MCMIHTCTIADVTIARRYLFITGAQYKSEETMLALVEVLTKGASILLPQVEVNMFIDL